MGPKVMKLSILAIITLAVATAVALTHFFPPCWCGRYSDYPAGTYYDEAPATWPV
jgi:hypothetical protein